MEVNAPLVVVKLDVDKAKRVRRMRMTLLLGGLAAAVGLATLLLEAAYTLGFFARLKTEGTTLTTRSAAIEAELHAAEAVIAGAAGESTTIAGDVTAIDAAAAALVLSAQAVIDTVNTDIALDVAAINTNIVAIDSTLSAIALSTTIAFPLTLHGQSTLYTSSAFVFPIFTLIWHMYKVGNRVIFCTEQANSVGPVVFYDPSNPQPLLSEDGLQQTGIGGATGLGHSPSDQSPSGPSVNWAPTSAFSQDILAMHAELVFTETFSVTTQGQFSLTLQSPQFPGDLGPKNPTSIEAINVSWITS